MEHLFFLGDGTDQTKNNCVSPTALKWWNRHEMEQIRAKNCTFHMRYIMSVQHLRNITSGLALKNVPSILSKRWSRQSMEQIRLKFCMSPSSKWNSNFSKMPPSNCFVSRDKPCEISRVEFDNWAYLLEAEYIKTAICILFCQFLSPVVEYSVSLEIVLIFCEYSSLWASVDIRPHVNKGFPLIWLLLLQCILFFHILSPVVRPNFLWVYDTISIGRHQTPC